MQITKASSTFRARNNLKIFVIWICILALLFVMCIHGSAEDSTIEAIRQERFLVGYYNELPVYLYTLESTVSNFFVKTDFDINLIFSDPNQLVEQCYSAVYVGLDLDPETTGGCICVDCSDQPMNKENAQYLLAKESFQNNKGLFTEILSINETSEYSIYWLESTDPNTFGNVVVGYLIVEWKNEGGDPPVTVTYGDLDGDKEITADDAAKLYGALRGALTLTAEQTATADVDRDGEITTDDAARVYAYVRGQITSFEPAGN